MRAADTTNDLDDLLRKDPVVAIGVSGGKDSQAAAVAVFRHLDRIGHQGPRILVHADLGSVEWADSLPVAEGMARHHGVDLMVVRRPAGGLMERWEARWASSQSRYERLETVTLVPCFSTPKLRFCTSEMKTAPIRSALKKRYQGQRVISVTGVRRAESKRRAMTPIVKGDPGDLWIEWCPLASWSTADVFSSIRESGQTPHRAYEVFGMSRVSCRFCIMQSLPDMEAAARQPETLPIYLRMVGLEAVSGFAFQGVRWLGDVAPHLLPGELAEALAEAKARAVLRREAESSIKAEMKYVKGWPLRNLTRDEAEILGESRRRVSDLYGFTSGYLDPDAIQERYEELLEMKRLKERQKKNSIRVEV